MPEVAFNIEDIQIAAYRIPSITAYNRLEVSPRTVDFDRSLRAEVRDALWMLTRQWQFGEFQGEDAATAMTTKILAQHTVLNEINFPGGVSFPYDGNNPLESVVEREKLTSTLQMAVQMARYFIKLLRGASDFDGVLLALQQAFPLNHVPDINDVEGSQLLTASQGKLFDGFAFNIALNSGTLPGSIAILHKPELDAFKVWYARNYSQPSDNVNMPWNASQLDYNFAVSSTGNNVKMIADHYHSGRLDWYSFDTDQHASNFPVTEHSKEDLQSYIPTPITFRGMPLPRFWMMEESRTDFGKIDTTPTGILHLLLAEFGLTCSNDWFMLPYRLPVNTVCAVRGIAVKDVFGQYTLVRPAGKGPDTNWQRWAMFHHTNRNKGGDNNINSFYLVPALIKSLEGDPLETVNFLRDEMANLVWAVEKIVPSQAGKGVNGDEMAIEKNEFTPPPGGVATAAIKYLLGTTVPHNWIPFIPVHLEEGNAEIRLQRARLPNSKGAVGQVVNETAPPHYIDEEIIPRSGVLVSRSFQLTRHLNGATCCWIGRKKDPGKGEGWSNLRFDQVESL